MNDLNIKHIIKIISIFLIVQSIFMFIAFGVAWFDEVNSPFLSFDLSALGGAGFITFFLSLALLLLTHKEKGKVNIRESYFIFSLLWILLAVFGAIPYYFSGAFSSYLDAFFESMSGFTTTGFSVLKNIDIMSPGLLFWRSATQWMGGIFFIVFSLSLLPFLGIGGVRFLSREPVSFHSNKFHPRMEDSIAWLCIVYLALTVLEVVALKLAGMSFFDAVCHSFTTISTGGFSTKSANIAYWNSPAIELIILVFMFLAGVNFALYFYFLKGKFKKAFQNEDLKYYSLFILVFSVLIITGLVITIHYDVFTSLRIGLFHVVSAISTTGFYTVNIQTWTPVIYVLMLILMFFGASPGSASGGLKVTRIVLVLKNSYNELKHFMHPNALSVVKYNDRLIPLQMINNAFLFLLLYILVLVIGALSLTLIGLEVGDSVTLSLRALSNIGGVIDQASLPALAKGVLILLMLIGRLELYAFFLLFTRPFWRK